MFIDYADSVAMESELRMLQMMTDRLIDLSDSIFEAKVALSDNPTRTDLKMIDGCMEAMAFGNARELGLSHEMLLPGNEGSFTEGLAKLWRTIIEAIKSFFVKVYAFFFGSRYKATSETRGLLNRLKDANSKLAASKPAIEKVAKMDSSVVSSDLKQACTTAIQKIDVFNKEYDKLQSDPAHKKFAAGEWTGSMTDSQYKKYIGNLKKTIDLANDALAVVNPAFIDSVQKALNTDSGDEDSKVKDVKGTTETASKAIAQIGSISIQREEGEDLTGPLGSMATVKDFSDALNDVKKFLPDVQKLIDNKVKFLDNIQRLAERVDWSSPQKLERELNDFLNFPSVKSLIGRSVRYGDHKLEFVKKDETTVGGKTIGGYISLEWKSAPIKAKAVEAMSGADKMDLIFLSSEVTDKIHALMEDSSSFMKKASDKRFDDLFADLRAKSAEATRKYTGKPVHDLLVSFNKIISANGIAGILKGEVVPLGMMNAQIEGTSVRLLTIPDKR